MTRGQHEEIVGRLKAAERVASSSHAVLTNEWFEVLARDFVTSGGDPVWQMREAMVRVSQMTGVEHRLELASHCDDWAPLLVRELA